LDSCFWSLDFVFHAQRAPILPDHAHFFPTETCVLDRHAEERVFVLLVVGGECVLVEHDNLNIGGAHLHEVRKLLPDAIGLDSRCMRSSSVMVMFYHSGRKALRKRPRI
jgi:hypothetical protein